MKITLDAVEALLAICDTGSFSAAARALGKVQSAVSYNVRQLESSLGVQIFDRSGHRATLTEAGQAILDEGRFLVARARRMEALGARLAQGWEPRLQVVVDGAVATGPILEALNELDQGEVPTHVQLRTEYLGGVWARFEELEADLMLALGAPPDGGRGELELRQLHDLEFVLVAHPQHAAALAGPIGLTELQQHLELSVHDSSAQAWRRDTNLIPGARVFYLGDFSAKREGLMRGLGVGWMPLHSVRQALEAGELVELDYAAGSRRSFAVSLAWRRDRPLGPAGERLRGLLEAGLGAEGLAG